MLTKCCHAAGVGHAGTGLFPVLQPPHVAMDEQELTGHADVADGSVMIAPQVCIERWSRMCFNSSLAILSRCAQRLLFQQAVHRPVVTAAHQSLSCEVHLLNFRVSRVQGEFDGVYHEEGEGWLPENPFVSSDSNDYDLDDNGYVHVSPPRLEDYSNQNGVGVSALGSPGMPWQCTGPGQDAEQELLLAAQQGLGPFLNALDPQPYSNQQQQQPGLLESGLLAEPAIGLHSVTMVPQQAAANLLAYQQQPGSEDLCTHQQGFDCAPVPTSLHFDLEPGPHQQQSSCSSIDSRLRHGMQSGKRPWQAEPGVVGPDTQDGMVAPALMHSQVGRGLMHACYSNANTTHAVSLPKSYSMCYAMFQCECFTVIAFMLCSSQ